ncbi:Tetratricopeptide TPR_2 repeat protein [Chloroherpeton thalassium ATCC 35110]|uniref:Tetratricopeptide TPR_2 repeat protein n=1 Tax=Chloroherpeton thalassium (strain ATCC 35110 / GB-78) TaxID=517418 RepID=B3QRW9_CHLT3|nr:tetratricopeptide repeat protein [Chloroherpeton thalassium]ACF13922.1 Tetratricopeptide TPR_2 repeat protein [Chloroherpeton thalassium ATCC 35110]
MNLEKKTCPTCGAALKAGQDYCLNCGSDLPFRFSESSPAKNLQTEAPFGTSTKSQITTCKACGCAISADAKFCASCGTSCVDDLKNEPLENSPIKKEFFLLLAMAAAVLVWLSILGWQSLFSAKHGFDLSGAAGKASLNPPAALPIDSLHGQHAELSVADSLELSKINERIARFESESSLQQKAMLAIQIANDYAKLKQLGAAGSFMQKAAELSDTNQDSLYLKAANLYDDGKLYHAAAPLYEKALELMPTDVDVRIDFAICLLGMGTFERGLAEMKKALELDPKHQIANLNMGIIYTELGKLQEALPYLEKAAFLNPNTAAGQKANELLLEIKSATP